MTPVERDPDEDLAGLADLDALAVALGRLRARAGAMPYAEIARRVGERRAGGGRAAPGKVTVYDCFRRGRRRIDADLVGDIADVLGGSGDAWRETARRLTGELLGGLDVDVELVGPLEATIVGRDDLVAGVPDSARVVVLSGLPGVGKSAAARLLAARRGRPALVVRLRGADGRRGAVPPVDVLRRMAGSLGVRALSYDARTLRGRVAAALPEGAAVVLEDPHDAAQAAALVVPGSLTIVTSRTALPGLDHQPGLAGVGIAHRVVPPLRDPAAAGLLSALLGPAPDGHARLVAMAGGLPLDLVMLAGAMSSPAGWSYDDLVARLEEEARDARLRPALEGAFAELSPPAAEALLRIALVGADVDADLLRAAGIPSAALAELRARHLVEDRDGRLAVHDVVQAFARGRARGAIPLSGRRAFLETLLDAATRRIARSPDVVVPDVSFLVAAASAAREHGLDAPLGALARAAHPALGAWGLWRESLALLDLAIGAGEPAAVPELALDVAVCAERLGQYDEALAVLARLRRAASGDDLARTWNQTGNIERWTGRFEQALASYDAAIRIARAARADVAEARASCNRADTLRLLSRYAEAEDAYAEALALAAAAQDELSDGIVRANRVHCRIATGRFAEAEADVRRLLDEAGDRPMVHVRVAWALLAEARGDDATAARRMEQTRRGAIAVQEFGALSDLDLLGARLSARAGRAQAAAGTAARLLEEAERAGSPLIAVDAGNTLAEIEVRAGRLDEARAHAAEAQQIADAMGDRAEIARSDAVLARIAEALGDPAAAERHRAASAALYREIGHRLGV